MDIVGGTGKERVSRKARTMASWSYGRSIEERAKVVTRGEGRNEGKVLVTYCGLHLPALNKKRSSFQRGRNDPTTTFCSDADREKVTRQFTRSKMSPRKTPTVLHRVVLARHGQGPMFPKPRDRERQLGEGKFRARKY
jgi:hypothetical protein